MNLFSATALAGVLAFGAVTAKAETVLNALFMSQAAYSEADVRAMADAYTAAHPAIKLNLEFVPYEGLRDKTLLAQGSGKGYDVVLFDVIWPAEYATNGILLDVSDRITPAMNAGVLPGDSWRHERNRGLVFRVQESAQRGLLRSATQSRSTACEKRSIQCEI